MNFKNVVELGFAIFVFTFLSLNVFAQNIPNGNKPAVFPQKGAQVIVTEGSAMINNDEQSYARNEAINNALKKAVEQAVNVILSSNTAVENYNILNTNVYAEATNYVHDYKILNENVNNNIYNVTLQVTVGLNHLKEELDQLGLLNKSKIEPTVAVIVLEQNIGQKRLESALFYAPLTPFESYIIPEIRVLNEVGNMSIAENELMKKLLADGINVEDEAVLLKDIKLSPGYKIKSLDDDTVREIGKLTKVDIIIYGKAVAKLYGQIAGSEMKSAQADISLRAVDVHNGEVLASGEQHAASVHIDAIAAGNEAIKKATDELAGSIIQSMMSRWKQKTSSTHHIKITINGINTFAELASIRDQLMTVGGISNIDEESIGNGDVTMNVDYNGDVHQLIDALLSKKTILSTFTTTNTTPDTIVLQKR